MKNLTAILEAAGTKPENAVKTLCFLTDMNDFAEFNEVYARYFTGRPARSCVEVGALPKGALCEVEAVAVLYRSGYGDAGQERMRRVGEGRSAP